MIFALISETKLVTGRDLFRMAGAMRIFAQHLSTAYMDDAPCSVVIVDKDKLLPKGCQPIVFVEDDIDVRTIAHHYYDHVRGVAAARVFVQNTTAFNSGPYSIFEAACHELAEARYNPYLAIWFDHPDPARAGTQVAYENADPTQDHYFIDHAGDRWQAANFVTPHWFRKDLWGRPAMVRALEQSYGYGLDWCKRLKTPGEIGSEGYAIMRRALTSGGWERWSEDVRGRLALDSKKLSRKRDPLARTQRLLEAA